MQKQQTEYRIFFFSRPTVYILAWFYGQSSKVRNWRQVAMHPGLLQRRKFLSRLIILKII